MHESEQSFEKQEESSEIKSLTFSIDMAHKTISGERIFGETIFDDLQKQITVAEESGLDVSILKAEVEELLQKIPNAEIHNILNIAEENLLSGDVTSAKSWHCALNQSIRTWEKKGLDTDTISEYQVQANELHAKLYGNEDRENEEKLKIPAEKIDEYVNDIDDVLKIQLSIITRGYVDDTDTYKPWPLSEVRKFCDSTLTFYEQKVMLYERAGDFEKASLTLEQIDVLKGIFSELTSAHEVPEEFLQKTKESIENNISN